ncbi:MAG: hypothetical protein OXI43_12650 [Candidatus Poribacteria bacterium]|nr:hypothetical protein [Candidatus Poribacteria bacterium]
MSEKKRQNDVFSCVKGAKTIEYFYVLRHEFKVLRRFAEWVIQEHNCDFGTKVVDVSALPEPDNVDWDAEDFDPFGTVGGAACESELC